MKDAAKHTRNLNTSMKLICPRFILEIREILRMFRTIRQPNNMYAVNNERGKFTFLEIYLKLTHFLSGKVQLIMIIRRNYNIQNINYYYLLWFSYQFM